MARSAKIPDVASSPRDGAQARFERAFHLAPSAIAIVRFDDGIILEANENFLQLVDRVRSEVVGKSLSAAFARKSGPLDKVLSNLPKLESVRNFEWSFETGSGSPRHVIGTFEMLGGEVDPCFLAVIRDVSAEREMERQIASITETERSRLRLELHDGLCQELAAAVFMVEVLRRKLAAFPEAAAALDSSAQRICDIVNKSILDTHALAGSLFPDGLAKEGLATILEQLAADTALLHRIRCTFKSHASPLLLGSEFSIHVYRVVQEYLRNAIATRGARDILLELEARRGFCALTLTDDGLGNETTDRAAGRLLSHRIRLLNATFETQPRKPAGLVTKLVFPLVQITGAQ